MSGKARLPLGWSLLLHHPMEEYVSRKVKTCPFSNLQLLDLLSHPIATIQRRWQIHGLAIHAPVHVHEFEACKWNSRLQAPIWF